MTIVGLSGNIWPVHPKPLPDELLSSWLVRLAHGHGLKLQTFCALVFGRDKSIWTRDIDKLAPDWLITKLPEATGASLLEVSETTLRSYEGVLYEHHQPNGNTRWIAPLGIFHRARKRHGLMFCPQCLREDAEPYFRKRWRLVFSTVCTKHGCYLLDRCPECESPLAPHRADMQGRQHYPRAGLNVHCWKCGFDLLNSLQVGRPGPVLVRFQALLDVVLRQGYADWAGNPSMHSLVFFEGLRAMIAGVGTRQTRERLAGAAKMQGIDLGGWTKAGLEMALLPMRREMFRWLAVMLENWPVNFIDLIRENKLRYADLRGDSACRPFWYEDVIRREAGGGHAPISKEEADAIANVVEARHGRFSGTKARELSGRDIGAHVAERRLQAVSDVVYQDLLTSIDHQVAGTLDKTERACLIRDKVMFAVGRQLRLSEGTLANLTLDQVRAKVPEVADLGFSDVARTPEQARAWVEWYWEKMRPQLQPMSDIDCIFTSAKTKRGFRHSAVGARFQRLVNAAMMNHSIHSYECLIATRH